MSATLLIVLVTAVVAGIGFWFYNRRQINSLTEKIEDKNAVISSFREHLNTPTVVVGEENSTSQKQKNRDHKKKRYSNRQKKSLLTTENNQPIKHKQNKPRKPKGQ